MKATGRRCLIVAVTIFAWLAISNHCALSAALTKKTETTSGCPFHSKPAKPQPRPAPTECCKVLRATSNMPAKTVGPAIIDVLSLDFRELLVFAPPKNSIAPAILDTGPPGKTCFPELNRSLRSHAPPADA